MRVTRVWADDRASSFRARHTAGEVTVAGCRPVDEHGIDPARKTETLADVVFAVNTGVGRGCRLGCGQARFGAPSRKEVVVTFKRPR